MFRKLLVSLVNLLFVIPAIYIYTLPLSSTSKLMHGVTIAICFLTTLIHNLPISRLHPTNNLNVIFASLEIFWIIGGTIYLVVAQGGFKQILYMIAMSFAGMNAYYSIRTIFLPKKKE